MKRIIKRALFVVLFAGAAYGSSSGVVDSSKAIAGITYSSENAKVICDALCSTVQPCIDANCTPDQSACAAHIANAGGYCPGVLSPRCQALLAPCQASCGLPVLAGCNCAL